jgi:phosphatidylserine/phosphatidylglycerophosphate/cardiolipin synthase-like enzyme
MRKTFITVFVLLLTTFTYSQVSPIADIRVNDANGAPQYDGQIVTVSGVVTASSQFGTYGPASIQDNTAGMCVYGSPFPTGVNIGDSVVVTAELTNYNGLAEMSFSSPGASFQVLSTGHDTDPEVITINDVLNQSWNDVEEYEGKLVRINNVTISESGNFAGGTNYTITDATGTSEIRIDNDVTTIIGTPIPSGQIDIIGILQQYDPSPPYSTGYQLLPRYITDIVDNGAPLILNPVFASNIDTTSFTVYFNTARNGNSQVKYGLTPDLEMDSVIINDDTTFHAVPVTGLQPSTQYYFKAVSDNAVGRSESSTQTVSTATSDTSIGTMNVYFNFSVDTTVAMPGNSASGNTDFKAHLIHRINQANYSIDLALYSFFGMQDVADAIILAKNRGVKVRVVYDSRNIQNSMQALLNAGILMSQRPSNLSGIMHNKFFIFDARDTIVSNDWLWTGSWNVTSTELTWKNNVVEINDPTITAAYQTEFEEMWGSNNDIPNPANAKFGSQKTDNTPHYFNIGGREVQLYFSPSDGTTSKIINTVNTANQSIYMALYIFTRNDIETSIHSRYILGATDIKGVIDQVNATGSEFQDLSVYADMWANPSPTLHHKYSIIDASSPESSPYVITGSHNWSSAAEYDNDENTLIIQDLKIANQYMQEFKKRYNEAGGTGEFIVPVSVADNSIKTFNYTLFQNYPNPFNPVTTIRFQLPYSEKVQLKIYDMLGREVETLYDKVAPAGIVDVDFNAGNLASGIYIYRIKAGDFISAKKLMLLK